MEHSFGTWVRRRRKALDLTQQELARRVGCSLSLIFKIESDERRPSRQVAELLAKHLEISPEQRDLFLRVARLEKSVNELERLSPLSGPDADSLRTPPQPPLPLPLTPLIGREHEWRAIVQQIQDPACRLLTLTGPGGVGKTRLALDVAHRLKDTFKDGACFVSLAGTAEAAYVVPAISEALGFSFSGKNEPQAQLLHYLRDRHLLLVLDNLEHLLHDIELLDQFLEHAPGVKLLVTSREILNLRAEWVFEVQGLPVPAGETLKDLESNSAAALFIQRARQAIPNFDPSPEDAAAILRICQLVEGLPLGLEIAATWLRTISASEIADEIERNLDFLTSSARDLPSRHRSFRAIFDYSWNLLTDDEKGKLRQLAVFSGGFTRDAARQVADADLVQLSALVGKSLLRQTSGRYDFHELVRQYVNEKAREASDEHSHLHDRHAGYFAAWLGRLEADLHGPRQEEILGEIIPEMDNLRSAWNWMIENRQVVYIQQSLSSLFILHDIRNWLHQGMAIFEQALLSLQNQGGALGKDDDASILLGELMVCQGHMCWHLGHTQNSRRLLQKGFDLLRHDRTRPMLSEAVLYLSNLEQGEGNYLEARRLAEECVSLNRQQGRIFGIGYALGNLGMICLALGEHEPAFRHLGEGVEVMRSINHPRGMAVNLIRKGAAAMRLEKYEEARHLLDEGLEIAQGLHDRWGVGSALDQLGLLAAAQKDLPRAKALLRESVSIYEQDGDQVMLASTMADLGFILNELEEAAEARKTFLSAIRVARQSNTIPSALYAMVGLARMHAGSGDYEAAFELATHGWSHPSGSWLTKYHASKVIAEAESRLSRKQIEELLDRDRSLEALIQEML